MIIDVLVCRPDGTREIQPMEFPDGWFDEVTEENEE